MFLRLIYLCFSIFLISCTNQESTKYNLYLRGESLDHEYIIGTNDLNQGVIHSLSEGVKLPSNIQYNNYYHNGYYYSIDYPITRIIKYKLGKESINIVDSCTLSKIKDIDLFKFVGDSTLLLVGLDSCYKDLVYTTISLNELSSQQHGKLLDLGSKNDIYAVPGFVQIKNNRLLLSYTYRKKTEQNGSRLNDTIFIATMSYPAMTDKTETFDTRSSGPVVDGRHVPSSIEDENGDTYFITNTNDIFEAKSIDKPSVIFRIEKNKNHIDPHFIINLNTLSETPISPVGIWYLKQGKVLLKSAREDLVKNRSDYWENIFEYIVIDLKTKASHKLSLPLDRSWYVNNVIIENGLVYIANMSKEKGNYIMIYNPKDETLVKGLELGSDINRIFRIDISNSYK